MISVIPNMSGMFGFVQRMINRPLYRMHVPLDKERFANFHLLSALEVKTCEYLVYINFGVCGLMGLPPKTLGWILKKSFMVLLLRLQKLVWVFDDHVMPLGPGKTTSAYITCVSQKSN